MKTEMKNCQIWTADKMFEQIKRVLKPEFAELATDIHFDSDGFHRFTINGREYVTSPNDCAYEVDMPLWVRVMVDEDGSDSYALLMYEN